GRGARVVLLAAEGDPQFANTDDGRDDADPLTRRLEPAALLDVRLEIGDIATGFHPRQRPIGDAGGAERRAHRLSVAIARAGHDLVHRLAAEGAAADEAGVGPLLVHPRGDVDREVPALG